MPLPDYAIELLRHTVEKMKLRGELRYYLIPNASPLKAPLLIINKPSKVKADFKKARDLIKQDSSKTFKIGKTRTGACTRKGARFYLVVDEAEDFLDTPKLVKWGAALAAEDDAVVTKLGALLKKARTTLPSDLDQEPNTAEISSPGELGEDDLRAFFPDDEPERVLEELARAQPMNAILEVAESSSGEPEQDDLQRFLAQALDGEGSTALEAGPELASAFVLVARHRVLTGAQAAQVGERADLYTQLHHLASETHRLGSLLEQWEHLIDAAEAGLDEWSQRLQDGAPAEEILELRSDVGRALEWSQRALDRYREGRDALQSLFAAAKQLITQESSS